MTCRHRAIAQTKMTISQRALVHGVLVDVVCTGRFYDFFEKRDGRWGLVLRQPIYEKDRMDPVDPAAKLQLTPELLNAFPEGYRHLAYLQSRNRLSGEDGHAGPRARRSRASMPMAPNGSPASRSRADNKKKEKTMSSKPFIVGIGGTTRPGSSSEQALSLALAHARKLGAETQLSAAPNLQMPMYDPATANADEAGRKLVEALRRADGVILSSPCYHGGVSGLVKNAIDYVEEMRADTRVYFDGRAVGAIGCGYGYQGPGVVLGQLRAIGHALRRNVPLGVAVNSAVVKFTADGCSEEAIGKQIEIMAAQVVQFAQMSLRA